MSLGGTFLIGQEGVIQAANTMLCVENWQCTLTDDVQDVTTVCSLGCQELITGIKSATLTGSAFYDAAMAGGNVSVLFTGLPMLFTASIGSTGNTIVFNGLISEVVVENPAKNPVKINFTARSIECPVITEG